MKRAMSSNTATSAELTYLPVHQFIMLITKCQVLSLIFEVDKWVKLDLDGWHKADMEQELAWIYWDTA